METYLMRHAEAVPQAEWNAGDSTRPLSEFGRDFLQAALPYIQKSKFSPEIVLTSPFVRAKETADIICSILNGKSPVIVSQLASGANIGALKSVVMSHKDKPSLLIIGHMPDLAHFASAITGDPWLLDDARMDPGAIWALDPGHIETAWGHGKFIWQRNLGDWKKEIR